MGFLYSGMGFAIGLMLIIFMSKESKSFYFFGVIFIFMGCWWLLNELIYINLFEGVWLWVFRGVMAVALVVALIVYYKNKKSQHFKQKN